MRWSGRVARSASHRRRQLRASRARGAIARAKRVVATSAANATVTVLDAMPLMGALHAAVSSLPGIHAAWTQGHTTWIEGLTAEHGCR